MKQNIIYFFEKQTQHNLFIVTANPEIVDYAQQDTLSKNTDNTFIRRTCLVSFIYSILLSP